MSQSTFSAAISVAACVTMAAGQPVLTCVLIIALIFAPKLHKML